MLPERGLELDDEVWVGTGMTALKPGDLLMVHVDEPFDTGRATIYQIPNQSDYVMTSVGWICYGEVAMVLASRPYESVGRRYVYVSTSKGIGWVMEAKLKLVQRAAG